MSTATATATPMTTTVEVRRGNAPAARVPHQQPGRCPAHPDRVLRTPQLLVAATVQGAMFLLIFRYVFGGAIGPSSGVSYVDFMVPGFVVSGVLFSGMGAAAGVAEDAQRGVVDRFRSLPIPAPRWPPGEPWARPRSSPGAP